MVDGWNDADVGRRTWTWRWTSKNRIARTSATSQEVVNVGRRILLQTSDVGYYYKRQTVDDFGIMQIYLRPDVFAVSDLGHRLWPTFLDLTQASWHGPKKVVGLQLSANGAVSHSSLFATVLATVEPLRLCHMERPAAQNHPPGITSGLRSAIKTGTNCLQIGLCLFCLRKSQAFDASNCGQVRQVCKTVVGWVQPVCVCERITDLMLSPFCVHCSPLFWGIENIWTEDWDGSHPNLPSKCFLLTNEARCFLMLVHSVSTVALCSEALKTFGRKIGMGHIPVFHPSASYWPMRRDVFWC